MMRTCPVCRTETISKTICPVCRLDFEPFICIETEAESHFNEALEAFRQKDFDAMYVHARRAASLKLTPKRARLLACAAVIKGKHDMAYAAWREPSLR